MARVGSYEERYSVILPREVADYYENLAEASDRDVWLVLRGVFWEYALSHPITVSREVSE